MFPTMDQLQIYIEKYIAQSKNDLGFPRFFLFIWNNNNNEPLSKSFQFLIKDARGGLFNIKAGIRFLRQNYLFFYAPR